MFPEIVVIEDGNFGMVANMQYCNANEMANIPQFICFPTPYICQGGSIVRF